MQLAQMQLAQMQLDRQWRTARAVAVGTRHLRDGTLGQDAALCTVFSTDERAALFAATIADGAGTATDADVGAALVCDLMMGEVAALVETGGTVAEIDDSLARGWITHFGQQIAQSAALAGKSPRDYACTFLGAIIDHSGAIFLQVGDGAMVYALADAPDDFHVAIWPQQGEFANETVFVNAAAAASDLAIVRLTEPVGRIALFSDGLQRLALNYAARAAHGPFFRPLFVHLETSGGPVGDLAQGDWAQGDLPQGDVIGLDSELHDFLTSPSVNSRTDDDKSLVLASRLRPCRHDSRDLRRDQTGDETKGEK